MSSMKYEIAAIPKTTNGRGKWKVLSEQLRTVPRGKAAFVPVEDMTGIRNVQASLIGSLTRWFGNTVRTAIDRSKGGVWVWLEK